MSWILEYIWILCLFNLSPGVSFTIVGRNTLLSRSLSIGLYTALGVALSDGISSLISLSLYKTFFGLNQRLFYFLRVFGVFYLSYLAIKIMTNDARLKIKNEDTKNNIITKNQALINGFSFTFSNPSVILSILAILSQFLIKVPSFVAQFAVTLILPIMSFISFAIVAIFFYIVPNKIANKITNNPSALNKISGIGILIFAFLQAQDIIQVMHK